MNDAEILQRINDLVTEEHTLDQRAEHSGGLSDDERARLKALEVNLDQCWDLLRQRRARRHAGQNPDDAATRPGETVEHYLA